MPDKYNRKRIEALLFAATESQRHFWDALSELESELDCEIDGERISGHDVDSLIALTQGRKSSRR